MSSYPGRMSHPKAVLRIFVAMLVSLYAIGIVGAPATRAAGTGQNGFAATAFATGLPGPSTGCCGPIGIAFDKSGNLLIGDATNDGLYRIPAGGGPSTLVANTYTPYGDLAFTKDGHLYTDTGPFGGLRELDPTTGVQLRVVDPNISGDGMAVDPLSGDIFVANISGSCAGHAGETICRISNFAPGSVGPAVETLYMASAADGLTFGPDGTLYTADFGTGRIDVIAGTNKASPGQLTNSFPVSGGPDGVAVSADNTFIAVNRNDGTITKIDLSTGTQTDIVVGGTRGDYVTVGPDS